MNPLPTRYALLRDRKQWDASAIFALAPDAEGALTLLPLPSPIPPIALPGPYAVLPSGVACAACASAFVADTAHHQIVYDDGQCNVQTRIPPAPYPGAALGQFDTPRGLAYRAGRGLYVADSGNARIVVLDDPTLETVAVITAGLVQPLALALDASGRLVVVDGLAGNVRRFAADYGVDAAYDATMAANGAAARFIAIATDDTLYVSNVTGGLARFDTNGTPLPALPALDNAIKAGALAVSGDRLYVADAATGQIVALDRASGATLAAIPRFRGPVTALAACDNGDLLIKTGDDATYVRCPVNAYGASGSLVAGPLDAGERDTWYFAAVEADTPAQTGAQLSLYANDDPTLPPAPTDWIAAPAPAVLAGNLFPGSARYLWLKAALTTQDPAATPRLTQVRAETPGEDYLDSLPAIYRKSDAEKQFLAHMAALLRTQFDRSERIIDGLPLRIAIDFAVAAELPWLAGWLGFALPPGLASDAQRELLHRIVALYDQRGTQRGIAEFVHVYTGVRPRVIEAFTERHLWQLGIDSALGFDTGLAPENPFGTIVPDPQLLCASKPPFGCDDTRVTIGSVVVGASAPLPKSATGAPLFADSAHRFRVVVPQFQAPDENLRNAIRSVIEGEKPAHTDYALCFVPPEMRVGMQSLVGFDTIVADIPAAATLAGMTLGVDAYLAQDGPAGRVGSQAQVGRHTILA
jgi:phage tail-like protein